MKGSLATINTTRKLIFIVILYINVTNSIKREHFKEYISFLSKITIKINTRGEQQFFSSSFKKIYYPQSIVINNDPQPSTCI